MFETGVKIYLKENFTATIHMLYFHPIITCAVTDAIRELFLDFKTYS